MGRWGCIKFGPVTGDLSEWAFRQLHSRSSRWAPPDLCLPRCVCLGIAHVSGKVPLSGQGVWQIHNAPFGPTDSLGRTLCICQTPCPERGTLPDTWVGSKQKGPAEQVAPRVSSLEICRFRVCVSPITPWRKYDSQNLFLEGTFWDKNSGGRFAPGRFCSLPNGQSLNTHRGKHRSGGAQSLDNGFQERKRHININKFFR